MFAQLSRCAAIKCESFATYIHGFWCDFVLLDHQIHSLRLYPALFLLCLQFPSLATQAVTLFRNLGFLSDTPNQPQLFAAYSSSPSTCGLYTIGAGAPMSSTGVVMTLRLNCSVFGMGSFAGFHVQDANTLFAISTTALWKFVAAPRTSTLSLSGTTWTVAPGYPVNQTNGGGLRYIAGRSEGSSYVIYGVSDWDAATSQTYLLRHVVGSSTWAVILSSGANRYLRGVFLPPCSSEVQGSSVCGAASPSFFPTPSNTPSSTPSNTASVSSTPSNTPSQSATNTATSSLSPGVSGSPTNTASPSSAPYKFSPSSILVWRLGSGAPITTNIAQPYFMDEWAISADGASASVIRTIPMPTSGDAACSGSLLTTFEGSATTSFDGRYVVTQCWTGPVGTTNVNSNSSWPLRQINRIGAASDLKFTRYSDIGTQNVRGVATLTGRDYWAQAGGGIRYVVGDPTLDDALSGSVITVTNASAFASIITTSPTSYRGLGFAATTPSTPQLLSAWSAASNNCGLLSIGSGAPTASGTTSAMQASGVSQSDCSPWVSQCLLLSLTCAVHRSSLMRSSLSSL